MFRVLQSVLQHPAVGDCAVVGLDDPLKGVVPLALCVLKNGEAWPICSVALAYSVTHYFPFTLMRQDQIQNGFKASCARRYHVLCVSGVQKTEEEIVSEMVKLVRDTIGPVAAFRKVLFVQGLPKTRSGKIPRSSLANLVNGKPYKVRLHSR